MALRGHASIQGSTDVPTLYDILPGYIPMPIFDQDSHKLASHIKKHSSRTGVWSNFDKYLISLLKAYYGDAATKDNYLVGDAGWRKLFTTRITASISASVMPCPTGGITETPVLIRDPSRIWRAISGSALLLSRRSFALILRPCGVRARPSLP